MKYLKLFFLLFLVITFSSCDKQELEEVVEDCPDDIDFGTINLMPISISFIPDIASKTVYYKDSLGNEQYFVASELDIDFTPRPIFSACLKRTGTSIVDFTNWIMTPENHKITLINPIDSSYLEYISFVNSIYFDTSIIDINAPDTTGFFYDSISFRAYSQSNNSFIGANFVSSERGNDVDGVVAMIGLELIPKMTILGKSFQNVYRTIVYGNNFLFNKEDGIVGFLDKDRTYWVLDRIE
jgi:hypothetical protein